MRVEKERHRAENMNIRTLTIRLLALAYGLFGVYIILLFRLEPFWSTNYRSAKECQATCVHRIKLLDYLTQFQRFMHKENVPQTLRMKLEEIIEFSKLDYWGKEQLETVCKDEKCSYNDANSNASEILDVCPEKWTGRGDNLYYLDNWRTENCNNAIPFSKVLSILLNPSRTKGSCSKQINPVLLGLQKTYATLPVLVANVDNFCGRVALHPQVQLITIKRNESNPGRVWNTLVNAVTTPYVLIGRDLDHFMWFSHLERPVRVLSNSEIVQIAGGAIRNRTGHWRVGCQQISLGNYILQYQDGYYNSKNDCMFCDHLLGPFISRTLFLRDNLLNTILPEELFFEDFFLRIKQNHHSVINCPDVMYFSSDPKLDHKLNNRTVWLPLVRIWELNRIVVANNHVFSYSCEESGLKCNLSSLVDSYLMPICCAEQISKALVFMDKFCRRHKIPYELAGGTVMGSIKLRDILPWDHDGDLFYLGNYSIFKKYKKEFKKHGFKVGSVKFVENEYRWSFFTPEVEIDMSGCVKMSYDSLEEKMFREVPTQAQLHGHWFYVMPNPGGYSRNNYGIETLKHAHHFRSIGQKFDAPYVGGYFKKCKSALYHACLDHFSADGSIQFYVPN